MVWKNDWLKCVLYSVKCVFVYVYVQDLKRTSMLSYSTILLVSVLNDSWLFQQ